MNTKRIQIDGYVVHRKNVLWGDYQIYPYEPSSGSGIVVCQCRVYIDIPADVDPTSYRINQLDEKEKAADAAYAALKTKFGSERNDLLCSVMEPS